QMANARGWAGSRCQLTVVPMQGWSRDMTWSRTGLRWVQTSPNIPRAASVPYYAATSIFGSLEGAALDVGIGTGEPFQMAGKCGMDSVAFARELRANGLRGVEPYSRKEFAGARLNLTADSDANLAAINIQLLSAAQKHSHGSIFARYHDKDDIFWKVYGSTGIRPQIEKGVSAATIVASWQPGVAHFKAARQPYLLY
ncbi:MAG: exo-beta-N-acetylmuramidase NamZ domain-containing protein, partial [Chthoniobacteraceae bacterium]